MDAEQEIVDRTASEADAESSSDDNIEELLVEEISIDGMCGVY